jgi:acetolactate synthase-1/2/3 large subunit
VEKAHLRRDAFQEVDYAKFFTGTAKWTAELSEPSRVADVMSRAIHAAFAGTPGPVVVSLPEDVLAELVDVPVPPPHRPARSAPEEPVLAEVAALLGQARRPLIIAGGELANPQGRAALLAAAEAWQVPVLVSFRRLDLFPNAHPLFAGELGFFNRPHQLAAFRDSDAILAVGTRLGDLTTQGYTFPASPEPSQPLVHVHRDPEVVGRNYVPRIGLACDSQVFLERLTDLAPADARPRSEWSERLRRLRSEITRWTRVEASDGVVFGNVVAALGPHIAPDAIVALDAGVSAAMIYRHYDFKPPQVLLTPITGAMGFGIPAATAAAMRFPERQVICLIGDGGFLMGGNELAVAAERNLPLVILLANNTSYAAIRVNLDRAYPGQRTATDLWNPDFTLMGQAYGCRTLRIDREDEVEPVLAEAFSERRLTFVEVRTSLDSVLPRHDAKVTPIAARGR